MGNILATLIFVNSHNNLFTACAKVLNEGESQDRIFLLLIGAYLSSLLS